VLGSRSSGICRSGRGGAGAVGPFPASRIARGVVERGGLEMRAAPSPPIPKRAENEVF
jgi:hypothetical protein